MEAVIGHESTQLFLLGLSYCSWRLSGYGKGNFNIIAFRTLSVISLLLIVLYQFRESIPGIHGISIVILILVMIFAYAGLPFPGLDVEIPEEKKKPLLIEMVSIAIAVLVIMGVWQRVSP